ncbi:hypothetical protein CHCC20327_1750 [Bacillus licheniformis]|nr:hypothetical protein CHCC20327_1750 [Bacillus licheniformis]
MHELSYLWPLFCCRSKKLQADYRYKNPKIKAARSAASSSLIFYFHNNND